MSHEGVALLADQATSKEAGAPPGEGKGVSERIVVEQVARYLQTKLPKAVYRFDLAADLKLTVGQASRHKRLHPHRGYPDLWIAHPTNKHHGLFIEIKKDGVRLRKVRSGEWATPHIAEQAETLKHLNELGYLATFGIGYEDCIGKIEAYMGSNASNDGEPF